MSPRHETKISIRPAAKIIKGSNTEYTGDYIESDKNPPDAKSAGGSLAGSFSKKRSPSVTRHRLASTAGHNVCRKFLS